MDQLLHLKYLEYIARAREVYEWMTERTQRVWAGVKELELACGQERSVVKEKLRDEGSKCKRARKNLGRHWLGSLRRSLAREIPVRTEEPRTKRPGPCGGGHVRVWSKKVPRSAA